MNDSGFNDELEDMFTVISYMILITNLISEYYKLLCIKLTAIERWQFFRKLTRLSNDIIKESILLGYRCQDNN